MHVVALVDDLMDRSRLSTAVPATTFARDASAATGADVVIVDLARHASAVTSVRAVARGARVVAYGPHVEGGMLDQARADGADLVVARSVFFRDPAALVHGSAADGRPE